MITTKGHIIDINGKTEWLLFHRLSKKINPVEFLTFTDLLIQFPTFLFSVSYLILIFAPIDLQLKFIIPASLYFCGQIIINLRIGTVIFGFMEMPLLVFLKFYNVIIPGVFITGFIFLGWWNLAAIPAYLLAIVSSVTVLTSYQIKFYRNLGNKTIGRYGIFKNNAFFCAYKFYAVKFNLPTGISPAGDEIKNEDWLKPYYFMRSHWVEIEYHFNRKAKLYWRLYLHPDE